MSLIAKHKLTDSEVRKIVLEWYLKGLEPKGFYTYDGEKMIELDEYLEETYNTFID